MQRLYTSENWQWQVRQSPLSKGGIKRLSSGSSPSVARYYSIIDLDILQRSKYYC
jgi:hypothetical protein